jgi:hypothetical protein
MRIALGLAFLCGCIPDLSFTVEDIECGACPEGWTCAEAIGRCRPGPRDETPPRLLSASAPDANTVDLVFDEEMAPVALDQLAVSGLTLVSAALSEDGLRLRLVTSDQIGSFVYVISVRATDVSGNMLAVDGSFVGAGTPAATSAPTPLSPQSGSRVFGATVELVWTPRDRASLYTVDVSTDPTFAGATQYQTAESRVVATMPGPVRVYWRVRADVTTAQTYGESVFDGMDEHVYVGCQSEDRCGVGNQSLPMPTVKSAIALASTIDLRSIRVAVKEGGYDEGSLDFPGGFTVVGGYAADFSARIAGAHSLLLGRAPTFAQVISVEEPLLLEGLEIVGASTKGQTISTALLLSQCGDRVTLRDMVVRGGSTDGGMALGLHIIDASPGEAGARVEDSEIVGGASVSGLSAGLAIDSSAPAIIGCTLRGEQGRTSTAVYASDSEAHLVANPSIVGGPGLESFGILVGRSANLMVAGNPFIRGGPAQNGGLSCGVSVGNGSASQFLNNDIGSADVSTLSGSESAMLSGVRAELDASTFTGGSIHTGTLIAGTANATVIMTANSNTVFDNVQVTSGALTATVGDSGLKMAELFNGASTITGCTLSAGSTTSTAMGSMQFGFLTSDWGGQAIGNRITLGGSDALLEGFSANGGSFDFSDNVLTLGAGVLRIGVRSALSVEGTIARNTIMLTDEVDVASRALDVTPGTMTIKNNVLFARDGVRIAESAGMGASRVRLTNNTIVAKAQAILLEGISAVVTNNVLLATGPCIQQALDTTLPLSLHHNALLGCSPLYRRPAGDSGMMAALNNGSIISMTAGVGNVTLAAGVIDTAGRPTNGSLVDLGLDARLSLCSAAADETCGDVQDDRDGNARPSGCLVPVACSTLGAFEP